MFILTSSFSSSKAANFERGPLWKGVGAENASSLTKNAYNTSTIT